MQAKRGKVAIAGREKGAIVWASVAGDRLGGRDRGAGRDRADGAAGIAPTFGRLEATADRAQRFPE